MFSHLLRRRMIIRRMIIRRFPAHPSFFQKAVYSVIFSQKNVVHVNHRQSEIWKKKIEVRLVCLFPGVVVS